jgi:sucrose phosphorylase
VIDHTKVDPRLGTWEDVRSLSRRVEIMADMIVNHVSSRSPQFEDFRKHGEASAHAGMFLTYGRVFPNGASEQDLVQIYRPRPGVPSRQLRLETAQSAFCGLPSPRSIDIDVRSQKARPIWSKS